MPRFFIDDVGIADDQTDGKTITVTGDDARHIGLSLRMKEGDDVTVCDGAGTDYFCKIVSIRPEKVTLTVVSHAKSVTEPPVDITLYQCFLKGDQADDVIRASVELGVGKIVFVHSKNAVSRPDEKSCVKKIARWQKIASEEAKQCGRGTVPVIGASVDFDEAVKRISESEFGFVCCETERELSLKTLLDTPKPKESAFLIGPEGGLAQSEKELLASFGVKSVTLGKRIMRARVAPLAVLSSLLFSWEL